MSDGATAAGPNPLPAGQAVISYGPAVFIAAQSVGRPILTTAMVGPPSMPAFDGTMIVLSVLLGALLGRWTGRPRPLAVMAVPVLAWVVAGVARSTGLFVGFSVGRVSGSTPVLADLVLVWVGAYAVATAVVFGLDWERIGAPVGRRIYPDAD